MFGTPFNTKEGSATCPTENHKLHWSHTTMKYQGIMQSISQPTIVTTAETPGSKCFLYCSVGNTNHYSCLLHPHQASGTDYQTPFTVPLSSISDFLLVPPFLSSKPPDPRFLKSTVRRGYGELCQT